MKHLIIICGLLLSLSIISSNADLLDCDDKVLPSLEDIPGVGPKVTSSEETGDKVAELFKKWGCELKKGVSKFKDNVKENAKKLNENVKEGVKKLKEKAKDLGTNIENKYHDVKDRLNKDSDEIVANDKKKFFLENVEIINPDILKADQECGHGHILDSLGNCRKLRK